MTNLFHISGWSRLSHASAGDEFSLLPGHQAVEGSGVYFAEGSIPPMTTAEGSRGGASAVVAISAEDAVGWWRTKPSLSRKFGRPRTWHSDRKSLVCRVVEVGTADVAGSIVPILFCSWRFATKTNPSRSKDDVRHWLAGGCLSFAKALKARLPGSRLIDIVEPQDDMADVLMHPGLPHHVVVGWRGLLIDAQGPQTSDEMLASWIAEAKANRVNSLRLEPHSAARARDNGLKSKPYDVALAGSLADAVAEEASRDPRLSASASTRKRNPSRPSPFVLRPKGWKATSEEARGWLDSLIANPRAPKAARVITPTVAALALPDEHQKAEALSSMAKKLSRGSTVGKSELDQLASIVFRDGGVPVGAGKDRAVFRLDEDDDYVVKIARSPRGEAANQSEAMRWSIASATERPWLLPVIAADPEGAWLVMRAMDEEANIGQWASAFEEWSENDLTTQKHRGYPMPPRPFLNKIEHALDRADWGAWRGSPVMFDYA